MTLSFTKLTVAVSTFAAMLFAGLPSVRADHFGVLHNYAKTLESQAERIDREVNHHFNYLPMSKDLRADVCEMARLADHIHDLQHQPASLRHMQSDLQELDERFHEVEDAVLLMRRMASGHVECRHARPNEYYVRRLSERVAEMGRTLHVMQDTVELLADECDRPVIDGGFDAYGAMPRPHIDHHSHYDPVYDGRRFSFSIRVR